MLRRPAIVALMAVLLTILIGAFSYFLLVAPQKSQRAKVLKKVQDTDNLISAEKSKNKTLLDIKNRSAEFEAKLAAAQAMIPAQPELPSLIRMLQAAADPGTSGADLPWLSFAPSDVTSAGGGGLSQYTFTLSMAGWYSQVTDFIYRMERFQRAVIVDSVSMTPTSTILTIPYDPNIGLVQAQISARTFTFASLPSASGAPATPTAPVPGSTPATSSTTPPSSSTSK